MPMNRVFAIAVLALIPCRAAAQSPAPVLTLEDALRLMRERNPDYRINNTHPEDAVY